MQTFARNMFGNNYCSKIIYIKYVNSIYETYHQILPDYLA